MSEEDLLRDILYDAIAASRNSIRVTYTKPISEDVTTFYVSFLMSVDAKTHQLLCASAQKKERTVPKLLRRYAVACFRQCICDEEVAESELKDAA
jgi:hypothetical protein